MPMWDEAIVHYELYRILKNLFSEKYVYEGIELTNVIPEWKNKGEGTYSSQRADLVITTGENTPFIVIEIKAGKQNTNAAEQRKVQEQAKGYAMALNAPYYIITDGEQISSYRLVSQEKVTSIGEKKKVLPGTRIQKRDPFINQDNWIRILKEIIENFLSR